MNGLGFGAFLGIFYGAVPALVLGLPAIYILRSRVAPTFKACVVGGAVIASVPVAIAAASMGLGLLAALLVSIPLGAVGGLVFWLVVARRPDLMNAGGNS